MAQTRDDKRSGGVGLFVKEMFSFGFLSQITKPTRVTTSTATVLDHMYSNTTLPESTNGIIINDVADIILEYFKSRNIKITIRV